LNGERRLNFVFRRSGCICRSPNPEGGSYSTSSVASTSTEEQSAMIGMPKINPSGAG